MRGGIAAILTCLAFAPAASADFRSVLAQGEGESVEAPDLAAAQASGTPPESFVSQQPLYVDIMPRASTISAADLDTFYKNTDFGSMPGGASRSYSPRPGVTVTRDKQFGMAHITAEKRADLMFGVGYATAEERLFLMDAIRNTAKGTLAGLLGAGSAEDDSKQLTDQDFSDEELTKQVLDLPSRFGPEGARGLADLQEYIAGINARIDEVNSNPALMPAEYPALGVTPKPWTISDTAAMAVLLVTQFTVSNGGEERNSLLQQAFRKRFGKRWRRPYTDLRMAEDAEAFTVAKDVHRSDRPGRARGGRNAQIDPGSLKPRNTIVEGPGAAPAARPAWVERVSKLKSVMPHHASNAVLVSAKLSKSGRPLAAMGPQVDYYSPQIFVEYELHGGGIDVEGVSFPGASPWPLIGHGADFAWSGTSANGDNNDTFVERLCDDKGTKYLYKGKCIPFVTRDQTVTTPVAPVDPQPPQTITYRTQRSVHGPVFAHATVKGKPVALTKAKGVNFKEFDAVLPFMRMAENQPTDAKSFMKAFSVFPGTENWFYVDNRSAAFLQSGLYPRHAKGSDVDLPFWGDGRADWQGFDPAAYTFKPLPLRNRPRALDPKQGFIISWNNKEAPGWRKGPTEWSNGPVHHALILQRRLLAEIKRQGGKVDLAGLARTANLAATTDLRGQENYPWMRRVIGKAAGRDEQLLKLLDAWRAAGSHRLDRDGDNVYEHSAAVALMDEWWPLAIRAEFEPALGKELFDAVEKDVLSTGGSGDDFGWAWASHNQKDLRAVLGKRVRGRFSRLYCGSRKRCRAKLLATLREGFAAAAKKQGTDDTSKWRVDATCEVTTPQSCVQNVPNTAGAVDTPPFPWQNRGTYHQVTEVMGRRGG